MKFLAVGLAALCASAVAQDPAQGWMAYAVGTNPNATGILTRVEAKWVVGGTPTNGGSAFYSPWIGIEASDNLNLIQTVNPWVGNGWLAYNEYFQWQPENNINSAQFSVNSGDILHGVMELSPDKTSYTMTQTDVTTGQNVTTVIPIQKDRSGALKSYTIVYIVFEKTWQCSAYPPEGKVTFYDVIVEYDNQVVAPAWKASVVDQNCDMTAHIEDENTISITWNPNGGGGGGSTSTTA